MAYKANVEDEHLQTLLDVLEYALHAQETERALRAQIAEMEEKVELGEMAIEELNLYRLQNHPG
jgi:hypothetical protein